MSHGVSSTSDTKHDDVTRPEHVTGDDVIHADTSEVNGAGAGADAAPATAPENVDMKALNEIAVNEINVTPPVTSSSAVDTVKANPDDPVHVNVTLHESASKSDSKTGVDVNGNPLPSSDSSDSDDVAEMKPTRSCWGRNGSIMTTLRTKNFYLIVIIGQCLALGTTGTNTFSTLLSDEGTSIPAFQSFFNYILLTLVYTSYTIYKYGFKGWLRLIWKDGWKYIIFSFCDVEGNYFVVLSYNYTTILSAQLINFWAIAMVVIVSFLLLKVKYHWAQILGILVCIGGMGVLFGSDKITGSSDSGDISRGNQIKGDMFALIGATFYGLSNVTEEYFVSMRPMYEVLGQMGIYGLIINGVQAGIFDRHSFKTANWNSKVGGYFAGYTLILFSFYSCAPLLFRLASAAFFNISLLTANFWGVIVGVKVFHYHIHWMYPIAFVLIIIGQLIYFVGRQVFGDESWKPWLGKNQEKGVDGIGTAKHKSKSNKMTTYPRATPPASRDGDGNVDVDLEAGVARQERDPKSASVTSVRLGESNTP
ncbi:hypothetical protein KEM55_004989 [Ascosphaera atra]|nr:hypothetical protein KEM55_004989 [Ascosphaera atra]